MLSGRTRFPIYLQFIRPAATTLCLSSQAHGYALNLSLSLQALPTSRSKSRSSGEKNVLEPHRTAGVVLQPCCIQQETQPSRGLDLQATAEETYKQVLIWTSPCSSGQAFFSTFPHLSSSQISFALRHSRHAFFRYLSISCGGHGSSQRLAQESQ